MLLQTAEIFQDHMILQREKPVAVWGSAAPNSRVSVFIQGKSAAAYADADGSWRVVLPALAASVRETLTISSGDETKTFNDVAVGEVWIAGGQSNMEFHMKYEKHRSEVTAVLPDRALRFFDVPELSYDGQDKDFDYSRLSIWHSASLKEIDCFSAVGFYFQRALAQELDVPVGIIGCNWGGTMIRAWMKPETLKVTAPACYAAYEAQFEGIDPESYWEQQHHNFLNDRGNLLADPFTEFVMPVTRSAEEFGAFLAQLSHGEVLQDFADTVMPQSIPGCLFQHMVSRITPFTVRGVLWYQGESDDAAGLVQLYGAMLKGMIEDWREILAQPKLPFLIVQLPGFESWAAVNSNEWWVIRRCQQEVTDTLPNTFLCSISDVGEQFDIHPKDKKTVGERLALLARKHVYHESLTADAPRLLDVKRIGDVITLHFAHAGSGLYCTGDTIHALELTSNGSVLPFETQISGDTVTLTLQEACGAPIHIAFAQTAWYQVNLYNEAGIPAIPFEADV